MNLQQKIIPYSVAVGQQGVIGKWPLTAAPSAEWTARNTGQATPDYTPDGVAYVAGTVGGAAGGFLELDIAALAASAPAALAKGGQLSFDVEIGQLVNNDDCNLNNTLTKYPAIYGYRSQGVGAHRAGVDGVAGGRALLTLIGGSTPATALVMESQILNAPAADPSSVAGTPAAWRAIRNGTRVALSDSSEDDILWALNRWDVEQEADVAIKRVTITWEGNTFNVYVNNVMIWDGVLNMPRLRSASADYWSFASPLHRAHNLRAIDVVRPNSITKLRLFAPAGTAGGTPVAGGKTIGGVSGVRIKNLLISTRPVRLTERPSLSQIALCGDSLLELNGAGLPIDHQSGYQMEGTGESNNGNSRFVEYAANASWSSYWVKRGIKPPALLRASRGGGRLNDEGLASGAAQQSYIQYGSLLHGVTADLLGAVDFAGWATLGMGDVPAGNVVTRTGNNTFTVAWSLGANRFNYLADPRSAALRVGTLLRASNGTDAVLTRISAVAFDMASGVATVTTDPAYTLPAGGTFTVYARLRRFAGGRPFPVQMVVQMGGHNDVTSSLSLADDGSTAPLNPTKVQRFLDALLWRHVYSVLALPNDPVVVFMMLPPTASIGLLPALQERWNLIRRFERAIPKWINDNADAIDTYLYGGVEAATGKSVRNRVWYTDYMVQRWREVPQVADNGGFAPANGTAQSNAITPREPANLPWDASTANGGYALHGTDNTHIPPAEVRALVRDEITRLALALERFRGDGSVPTSAIPTDEPVTANGLEAYIWRLPSEPTLTAAPPAIEDATTDVTLSGAYLSVASAGESNAWRGVEIVSLPAQGTLKLGGAPLDAAHLPLYVSQREIDDGMLHLIRTAGQTDHDFNVRARTYLKRLNAAAVDLTVSISFSPNDVASATKHAWLDMGDASTLYLSGNGGGGNPVADGDAINSIRNKFTPSTYYNITVGGPDRFNSAGGAQAVNGKCNLRGPSVTNQAGVQGGVNIPQPSQAVPQGLTIYLVFMVDVAFSGDTNSMTVIRRGANGGMFKWFSSDPNMRQQLVNPEINSNTVLWSDSAGAVGSKHLVRLVYDGSNCLTRVDKVAGAAYTNINPAAANVFDGGDLTLWNYAGANNGWCGRRLEMIEFAHGATGLAAAGLTQADDLAIRQYLNTKWGLGLHALSLAVDSALRVS